MKSQIKSITFNNFRLFCKQSFYFSEDVNIIVGKNAAGKTTILEGINLLGVGKSFRTHNDADLLKRGEESFYVKGLFNTQEGDREIVLSYTQKGKKINVNGSFVKKMSDFVGQIKVICFSPIDLNIVKGEPKHKRSFLDQNIGIIDKQYLNSLIMYNKLLKERNELLKQMSKFNNNIDLLSVYTDKLIVVAKEIINKRNEYIKIIESYANTNIKKISDYNEQIELKYKPNVSFDEVEDKIKKSVKEDILNQTTTLGPHKDTFNIYLNNEEIGSFGSYGQQKSVAIALKLAISDIINNKNDSAIIILDDVFGELDNKRQDDLIRNLKEKGQVVISTTDISLISKDILKNSKVIEMDEGEE